MAVLQQTGASYTNFLPDANLMVRNSGQVALTASFVGAAMDLKRLTPFWERNSIGVAHQLLFAVKIESIIVAQGQVYTFTLEIDDNSAFSSATVAASEVVSETTAVFHLALPREAILFLDATAAYVRLKMTTAQVSETGTITFSAVADNGDVVTINDGVHSAHVFTFGDGTGGTVDHGATATDSAQNLKAAINALGAGVLNVTAAGGAAALTITNNTAIHGSITKTDVDNDYVIVNFTGLGVPSIQFWSFVRGGPAT